VNFLSVISTRSFQLSLAEIDFFRHKNFFFLSTSSH
jgi:hypothetical protein